MCLILVAWQSHPDYPLLVAANRDEFFARPTKPAQFWTDAPDIVAGRDLKAGGTWMGVCRNGRFAALTNFRDPANQRDDAASRGQLVADFLRSDQLAEEYLSTVAATSNRYNGFNLMVCDGMTLAWFSNVTGQAQRLPAGVYGLSNHLLDSPWPKVETAKSAMMQALVALPEDNLLFGLLSDPGIYPDQALPRTGVSIEWERLLSAAFVRSPNYGTRSSTVLMIGRYGHITFDEQTWLYGPRLGERRRFSFTRAA